MKTWNSLPESVQLTKIESQYDYERKMLDYGRERYWRDYNRAPDEGIPEQELIDSSVLELESVYQEWIDNVCQSTKSPQWLYPLLEIGARKMADITMRAVIRSWFSSGFWGYRWNEEQHTPPLAQSVATQIAQDACDIMGFQRAKETKREDWMRQSKFIKNWTTKRCKAFALKMGENINLSIKQKHDFGHHMLRIAACSNIILLNPKTIKKGKMFKKYTFVEIHGDVLKELHQRHQLLETSSLIYRPMLAPPEEHTLIESGGYQTITIRKPVVQGYRSNFFGEYPKSQKFSEPSQLVLDGLNNQMKTEWTINEPVLDVMETMFENNSGLANLPYYSFEEFMFNEPFPKGGSKEEQAIWCQKREEAWGEWYKQEQGRGRMLVRIKLAKDLIPHKFFYHVYTLDFRGRSYTTCELLSPQSSDLDRGLIMLKNGQKLTERGRYWQKINLANLFDQDKLPFNLRIEWVDNNWAMIKRISEDPYSNREWIDDAKKKNKSFQRLAAVFDICRDDGYSYIATNLDGKCNGNQHLSAIMADPIIAKLTGVSPSHTPEDLYQHVADVTTMYCTEHQNENDWHVEFLDHWESEIPRNVTKRSTMCDAYGLTFYGIQKYLKVEGHLDWIARERVGGAIVELARAIQASLNSSLVEPNKAKSYLKSVTSKANELNKHLSWTTPSGFKVVHYYNQVQTRRSLAKLFNNKELTFFVRTCDVDTRGAIQAISPNFVHSLDAAHMFMTIKGMALKGIEDYCMIHDSFGCHPNQVDDMLLCIKEEFLKIHSENQLEKFKIEIEHQLGIQLPPIPERGNLDLSGVLESQYFFA